MKKIDSNWKMFEQSGSVKDYLNYKNNVSQNVQIQGVTQNAHQDGWNNHQRTEYR